MIHRTRAIIELEFDNGSLKLELDVPQTNRPALALLRLIVDELVETGPVSVVEAPAPAPERVSCDRDGCTFSGSPHGLVVHRARAHKGASKLMVVDEETQQRRRDAAAAAAFPTP